MGQLYYLDEYRARKMARQNKDLELSEVSEELTNSFYQTIVEQQRADLPCYIDTMIMFHERERFTLNDEQGHILVDIPINESLIPETDAFMVELLNNLLIYNPNKIISYCNLPRINKVISSIWTDFVIASEHMEAVEEAVDSVKEPDEPLLH